MRVSTNQLQTGCILTKDILSLTNKPIVPKKTVLTDDHIDVIKAFLVKDIYVDSMLVNGEPFRPTEVLDEEEITETVEVESTTGQYLKTVQEYKKLFSNWQAGAQIDIAKVRNIIIPLFERMIDYPKDILQLHHYATKDDYLSHHSVVVGLLSGLIGKKLNYDKGECIQLMLAGLLSDCGMSKIDPRILSKKSSLTSSEYSEVKNHPLHSYRMLEKIPVLKESVKLAVFQHHERVDGSGYMLGVTGEKLHPFGKIVAVADIFNAMISERPYSGKQAPFKVLEQIIQDSFGKFDLKTVQALTSIVANLTIGTNVRLSSGQIGEVVFVETKSPTRPMVKLTQTSEFIQLDKNREIYIEEIL
ncbi:HD-GYP domain-containing protein [Bacillus luteolus]|uniref:HD-GYP domain-containing protein n=1 Tax=Litchfieldia luteola TaxID=682179 RepID=A0ABR9QHG8_9BACI|nr:HD-GYP domain-containing protein [Cytobacillus luteolus]MBE4907926.1 HD-GYP domain-containing protein [Cytobacillus luteolus]MBP1943915.1 HD-GYP domain-containing protein (c-di-GMP phosphodiesterase class II) [Cytobacillus luteolus]